MEDLFFDAQLQIWAAEGLLYFLALQNRCDMNCVDRTHFDTNEDFS